MKIRIPDLNGEPRYVENKRSIVLIGANGSGKTRMSVWIDENNPEIPIHRISAQKSLDMPVTSHTGEIKESEEKLLYGGSGGDKNWLKTTGKHINRWGKSPETHQLNDFIYLMEYLMTDLFEMYIKKNQYNDSINNSEPPKLHIIKSIWEDVIIHRKLEIHAGRVKVIEKTGNATHNYNGHSMSDGERAVFYYIGEVLCAPKNSLVIIDEPENHLHQSILIRLWDAIENARPDCCFLYITHNVHFASSRLDSQIVWVKEMSHDPKWEYELLDEVQLSDSLLFTILGSRQKVLLVEGTQENSIDIKLYSKIYPEYNIIPLEGCSSVISAVKLYKNTKKLHYVEVIGIIDRDRRTEKEISELREINIFVPQVAEVENLFLLPEIIEIVAIRLGRDDYKQIIADVQDNLFIFIENNIQDQALSIARQKIQSIILSSINKKSNTIEEYKQLISNAIELLAVTAIYNNTLLDLKRIIQEKDFMQAIKLINHKGLLQEIKLPQEFAWKKKDYIDQVIRWTGSDNENGEALRNIFKKYITLH